MSRNATTTGLRLVVGGIWILTACAPAATPTATQLPAATVAATASAAPAYESELVIYSPHDADMIDLGVNQFQEQYGIKVSVVIAGTGELLQRIRAEKDRPLGDLMWGGGPDSLAANADLFESYKSQAYDSLVPAFSDPNYLWTPFTAGAIVLMYNKNLVPENEVPQSWAELNDPKWEGMIANADSSKSGSSYTALCTMLHVFGKGDAAWGFVEELTALEVVLPKSSLVYTQVGNGELPLGITFEEGGYKFVAGGGPAGLVYPSDGTSVLPDAMAVIQGAAHPNAAGLFIDFAASREFQQTIVDGFPGRRSVRSDIELPAGLPPPDQINIVDYDLKWCSDNSEAILARWQEILVKTQ